MGLWPGQRQGGWPRVVPQSMIGQLWHVQSLFDDEEPGRHLRLVRHRHLLMVRSPGSLAEMASTGSRERQEYAGSLPRTARMEVSRPTSSTSLFRLYNFALRRRRCSLGRTGGYFLVPGLALAGPNLLPRSEGPAKPLSSPTYSLFQFNSRRTKLMCDNEDRSWMSH